MFGITGEKPEHVRPPGAITRRMRITRLIGVLMVYPMRRHPEDRSAFQRQRAAHGEKILQYQGQLVGSVRVQPVVAHADAETRAHPIQENRHRERMPVEHEKRSYRTYMEKRHDDSGAPVYVRVAVDIYNVVGAHESSKM
jgi:hypothetical protein